MAVFLLSETDIRHRSMVEEDLNKNDLSLYAAHSVGPQHARAQHLARLYSPGEDSLTVVLYLVIVVSCFGVKWPRNETWRQWRPEKCDISDGHRDDDADSEGCVTNCCL